MPSGGTTPFQKQPKTKKPKNISNNEDIPKTNKFIQYFEAYIKEAKTLKQKYNKYDNPYTKYIESSSSGNKNYSYKNYKLKHTKRSITHMVILPKK